MNFATRCCLLLLPALAACRGNPVDRERIVPDIRVGERRPAPALRERRRRIRRVVQAINARLDIATSETRRDCLDRLVALGPEVAPAVREVLGPTHPLEADLVLEALGQGARGAAKPDDSDKPPHGPDAAESARVSGSERDGTPDEEWSAAKAREIENALVRVEKAKLDPVARLFERRYWIAQQRMLRGDVDGSLRMVDACIELAPTPGVAKRFRALRLRLKREAERRTFFDVSLESSEGAFPLDYPAALRLVVVNRGLQPLTITFSGLPGADPAYGALQLEFTLRDAFGSIGSQVAYQRLDLTGEHIVPKNQVLELGLPFNLPADVRDHALVVDVRAQVHIRPQRVLAGTRPINAAFDSKDAGFRLVGPPFENVRDNALAALVAASKSGAERALFVSTAAVTPVDRARAAQTLVNLLDGKHKNLERSAMASLRLLSGQTVAFTPAAWRTWWSVNRAAWRHAQEEATGRMNENPVFPWQE